MDVMKTFINFAFEYAHSAFKVLTNIDDDGHG